MRVVSLVRLARCLALLGVLVGVGRQAALAQEISLASRAPRFFVATSAGGAPVEVEAGQYALLRQVVSLRLDKPTVGRLLAEIERQAGLRFGFSRDILPIDRVVALRADTITVGAALVSVLMGTGVDVLLSSGHQVTLVKRIPPPTPVPTGTIHGRVTDAKTGTALAGAEVFLEGTRWRATTDTGGRYRLAEVDTGSYTLTARRLGYAKQSRAVAILAAQEGVIDVELVPVPTKLDELVTTATGSQRRIDLGNAITTIRADSVIAAAPIRNVTDLLETRVPGLMVQPTTGAPGDPARLRLRGTSSLFRSNDPIVIVDGIRMYSDQSNVRSGNLADLNSEGKVQGQVPAPSPLDQLDPNSIETIEVFKGPSAATLYGADASNGVIVITTKRGRPGPARWTANVTQGMSHIPGTYPNAYFRWGHQSFAPASPTVCPLSDLQCVQDSVVQFQVLNDPALTVFGRGAQTRASMGVSGGTEALQYSLQGAYGTETGLLTLPQIEIDRFREEHGADAPDWMRRPHHLTEWSGTSRITAKISRSADVSLTTGLTRQEQQRSSLENQIGMLAGTYVDVAGQRYYRPGSGWTQPSDRAFIEEFYQRTTASTTNLTTGLQANWRPASWLQGAADAGVNFISRADESLVPPEMRSSLGEGMLSRGTGQSVISTLNLRGTASLPLWGGVTLQTSVGANYVNSSTKDLASQGIGLAQGTNSLNGAQKFVSNESMMSSTVVGWYIQPALRHRRFALSPSIRLDGGTSYGTRTTLSAFPKLDGSWLISDEPFFPLRGVFQSLRLRVAYGHAGQQPGVTDRLRLFSRSQGWVNGDVGDIAQLTTLGNTQLRPERSTELEGGVDADLLDGLLSVEVTAYRKTLVDALMPVPIAPSVYGDASMLQNVGVIRNTGLELSLDLTPVRSSAVTWSSRLNLARHRNVVTELGPGVEPFSWTTSGGRIVPGYPLFGRWARPIVGYADANGDGTIAGNEVQLGDSLVYMGEAMPNYETSLHTNLSLLNGAFTIGASFDYQNGLTQVNGVVFNNRELARGANDPSAPFSEQAAIAAVGGTMYGVMETVSTLRFNALSLTYMLPTRVAGLMGARYASVAVQGSNLGLHTNYRGKDPNVNAASIGNDVIDGGQLPQPREWSVRVDLHF